MKKRNSNIELLKIIAIFIIVINHVTMTLTTNNMYSPKYLLPEIATLNIQHFIIFFFRHFGSWGNCIFLICSSWFLLDQSKVKIQKVLKILLNVYVISIMILVIMMMIPGIHIEPKYILYSLFPNVFANNWFVTCYLLLYLLHPYLNIIINTISKNQLLLFNVVTFVLYILIGSIKSDLLFNNSLIMFIVIYMFIAYVKLYMKEFQANTKKNVILFIVSFLCLLLSYTMLNIIGSGALTFKISFLSNKIIHFNTLSNPFILLSSIAIFNIFNNFKEKNNKVINYISSLTLLLYIIHENILLIRYIRPLYYIYIYNNFGYNYIIIWVLLFTLLWFVFSLLLSILYERSIYKIVDKTSAYLTKLLDGTLLRKLNDKKIKN